MSGQTITFIKTVDQNIVNSAEFVRAVRIFTLCDQKTADVLKNVLNEKGTASLNNYTTATPEAIMKFTVSMSLCGVVVKGPGLEKTKKMNLLEESIKDAIKIAIDEDMFEQAALLLKALESLKK